MLVRGWTFGFLLVPLQAATFATIKEEDTGRASAVFNAGRQVAASLGVALLATVLIGGLGARDAVLGDVATAEGALLAFREAFIVAAAATALGLAAALFVSDRLAAATMRTTIHGMCSWMSACFCLKPCSGDESCADDCSGEEQERVLRQEAESVDPKAAGARP
jgi:hypothetical protein